MMTREALGYELFDEHHPKWKPTGLHGTKLAYVQQMYREGILAGGTGEGRDVHTVLVLRGKGVDQAGIRNGSEAVFHVDYRLAMQLGCKFWLACTGTILTEGVTITTDTRRGRRIYFRGIPPEALIRATDYCSSVRTYTYYLYLLTSRSSTEIESAFTVLYRMAQAAPDIVPVC